METRNATKSTVIAVLIAIGFIIIGIIALVPQAVMAASLGITDGSVTTNDGTIQTATADVSGEISWEGAEVEPGETVVTLQVLGQTGSAYNELETKTFQLSEFDGEQSYSFTDVDLTTYDINLDDFEATTEGSSKETDVTLRIKAEPVNDVNGVDGGMASFTSDDTKATLTVHNQQLGSTVRGSGSLNAT